MKIKKSQLKEIFLQYGLSEGIFDLFLSKKKQLKDKISSIDKEIEDTIKSAPTDKDKQNLKDLSNFLRKSKTLF
jgi:CO dehydrogenase/acetyl-CoA synthase beta subunit